MKKCTHWIWRRVQHELVWVAAERQRSTLTWPLSLLAHLSFLIIVLVVVVIVLCKICKKVVIVVINVNVQCQGLFACLKRSLQSAGTWRKRLIVRGDWQGHYSFCCCHCWYCCCLCCFTMIPKAHSLCTLNSAEDVDHAGICGNWKKCHSCCCCDCFCCF